MSTHNLRMNLGDRSYDLVIGNGLLQQTHVFSGLEQGALAVIVTNTTVAPLYAQTLERTLKSIFPCVKTIVLPDGEAHKNWDTLNTVFTQLLELGADRKTTLFALGGGVLGDVTGFAAACYMRGISCVQVPTTLLAQVDSSVGGKTAINHPLGKNMIGAFHQPQRVIADVATLKTLPLRELKAGLAEVIKYGPIYDIQFLNWLDQNMEALLNLDAQAIVHAVRRSCEIKAEIVAQDERENGLRAILNLGHTFGHAIEAGVGYGVWLHGEAVACGMLMAADLSVRMGLLPQADYHYLKGVIERAGLPTLAPALGVEPYFQRMQHDKKAKNGEIHFVLLEKMGKAVVTTAPKALVLEVLHAHQTQ